MSKVIPADEALAKVGVDRHQTKHFARAVTAEQTIYILHSQECLDSTPDLLDCDFSLALDYTDPNTNEQWVNHLDLPEWVEVYSETVVPAWHEIDEAERFKPGARVRIKDDAKDAWDCTRGREYVIESYVDKTERDDPQPYYMVDGLPGNYCSGSAVPHSALAQVMSAKEHAKAMKMPEPEDLAKAISGALHQMDDFSIFQTEVETTAPETNEWPEGKHPFVNGVTLYGRTPGGKSFGAVVRITALWETDD